MALQRRLALAPDPAEVTRLNAWLDDAFAAAGTVPTVAGDLKLCLNEAVANVIGYAFDAVTSPEIDIEIGLSADRAIAVVTDNGRAFDPLSRPSREKLTSLEDAEIGGFGIHLIRDFASALSYQRIGNRNRLTITCESRR